MFLLIVSVQSIGFLPEAKLKTLGFAIKFVGYLKGISIDLFDSPLFDIDYVGSLSRSSLSVCLHDQPLIVVISLLITILD